MESAAAAQAFLWRHRTLPTVAPATERFKSSKRSERSIQTFQPTHVAPRRVLTRRGQIVQVAFTVIGHGSLGAGGNTSKRRLTEMSLWLLKKVVVLVTPWVKTSGGYEHGAREEYEEGVSPKPKIRGETERKMEMMGHDTSQPATSAVRGTKPRSE